MRPDHERHRCPNRPEAIRIAQTSHINTPAPTDARPMAGRGENTPAAAHVLLVWHASTTQLDPPKTPCTCTIPHVKSLCPLGAGVTVREMACARRCPHTGQRREHPEHAGSTISLLTVKASSGYSLASSLEFIPTYRSTFGRVMDTMSSRRRSLPSRAAGSSRHRVRTDWDSLGLMASRMLLLALRTRAPSGLLLP